MLTDGSGREYADMCTQRFAYKWVLQKLVEGEYEQAPAPFRTSSVDLAKEIEDHRRDIDPRCNQFEGPLVPRFDPANGLYHIELFRPEVDTLLATTSLNASHCHMS